MVQVVMVRGLSGNWKQPIFYNYNYKMTNEILLSIISELFFKFGFAVVATVSDLEPENQHLWKSMGISPDKLFFKNSCDENKIILHLLSYLI